MVYLQRVFCQSKERKIGSCDTRPGKCELLSKKDGLHPSNEGTQEMTRLVKIALKIPGARNSKRSDVHVQYPYQYCDLCKAAGHGQGDCKDFWYVVLVNFFNIYCDLFVKVTILKVGSHF